MGYLEYNDYKGSVEYNEEKKCLYGKVIGIKKNIYYEGTSVEDLTNNFKEAIDSFTNQSKRYSKKRKKKERNKELEKALLGYYEIFLKGLDSKETYYNQIETIDKQLCEKDEDGKGVNKRGKYQEFAKICYLN